MEKKILVIEDDNILQDAIKQALEKEGFKVIQSLNGEDGLEKAKKENPDLILLDLILPKTDGYHLIYKFCRESKTKKIPVIVLTVIDSQTSSAECKSSGVVDYLVKSEYTIQEIVQKVKKYIK